MIWGATLAGEVSLEDAPFMMNDYMGSSLDTTIFAISWLFSLHPEQWTKLRENPNLFPSAMNEAVRIKSPIYHFSLYVAKDVEVAGVT